jgi:hypothetical protein
MGQSPNQFDDRLGNIRIILLTSIIIAVAVNVVSFYIVNNTEITIIIIIILFLITVFMLIILSGFETTRYHEIYTAVLYDGTTGEITNFPDNAVQTLIRQTLQRVQAQEPEIQSVLSSGGTAFNEPSIFIEMAEIIILSQVRHLFNNMSFLKPEYLVDFIESQKLPSEYQKNSIIKAIRATILKDNRAGDSLIDTFEAYWKPKNGSLTISHSAYNRPSESRRIVLQNPYIRITIDYHLALNTYLSYVKHWLRHGAPFPDIGGIAIDPRYQAEALKRHKDHELRLVSFSYEVKTEIRKSMILLFTAILKIPPWRKNLKRYLSLLNYFIDNLDYTPIGSIDSRSSEAYEREELERRFILESMALLREYLDRDDRPSRDNSDNYIR